MARLGLHHLTALDASPLELISIARETGCDEVCVFTHCPPDAADFPVLEPRDARAFTRGLDEFGIAVANIEFFPLHEQPPFEVYRRGIELGAAIGGRRIVTHIFDFDRGRALAHFALLCGFAAEHGLEVGLEFMALSPALNTLSAAIAFLSDAAQPNAAVAIDVLHLIRSGGTVTEVAAMDAAQIGYAQICDGPATMSPELQMSEAAGDRMVPGDGAFPLVDFVAALPPNLPIDVEVPLKTRMEMGMPAVDRARLAVEATRRIFQAVGR